MKWKKNINVALKSRTSVLEVSYKDTNKDIIFPVITKISEAYKAYPGRDKNKSLLEAIDYFNKQILLYRDKSEKAYRDYLSYSLENDLKTIPNITNLNANTNNKENNIPVKNIDIDPRILIQNQIKEIEFEINEIKSVDLSNYDDQTLPMFFEVPEAESNSLVNVVNRKVIELSNLRTHFNENDRQILELKQNIKDLNKVIHSNMIEYLSTEIRNLNSRLKLVSKPKEVVIKFKELQRDLIRLETILTNLENNKQVVSLQLAEKTNPWDLISTPILNDSQVAPNKKQVVLLGLIASILLGVASAIYADKFSGLIYSSQELKSIFKYNFLNIVDLNKDWKEGISLIARNINNELKIKSLGIIMTKENDNYQEKIIQNLAKTMANVNIVTSNKLTDLDMCENIILLVQQGKTKRDELFEINQNLKLLNKPLLGLIFINSI